MALLAGDLDLPPAPGCPQPLLTLRAAEVFVGFPFPKTGVLEFHPVFNGRPKPQKAVKLPLASSVVPGEHPEQHIDEHRICQQGDGPE